MCDNTKYGRPIPTGGGGGYDTKQCQKFSPLIGILQPFTFQWRFWVLLLINNLRKRKINIIQQAPTSLIFQ